MTTALHEKYPARQPCDNAANYAISVTYLCH
jgi:hypothetical protein